MSEIQSDERRVASVVEEIAGLVDGGFQAMEVCGTHTVSIFRSGIRSLLPEHIELISGPGCPVCVTPIGEIDRAVRLAHRQDVVLLTFGDLMRVPGSTSSLSMARAEGSDVRVITSPLDTVEIARGEPGKKVVFFAVGFETTSPAIAAAVREAQKSGIGNLFVLSSLRLIPPALRVLLSSGKLALDGFLLPGHVSVIIGAEPYSFLPREFSSRGVITGFEPLDILEGLSMLLRQRNEGRAEIEIQYRRAVRAEGNPRALRVMDEIFIPVDARWRGLGIISDSGLALRKEFGEMDAAEAFDIPYEEVEEPPGCRCGEVLQGLIRPPECPLFGVRCTPMHPVGPCMVSSEGSCAAFHRYGGMR
ncbi:MAG: hydrogenase formation protein HypD [Deltaproteobacteria bacterium]|nr:hydrogenase formation protein HypD [Deltaproteobacteria bacterium]MBW2078749.1 hydrogenase formation protein HypD [Deltaproteobacteria bacterium]RLB26803.1 MAG: hydrogenase formation protein HypD [Deltaproteobacteria bacterium]